MSNKIVFWLHIARNENTDTPHTFNTAVRLHVYLVFVKSIEQELKIQ